MNGRVSIFKGDIFYSPNSSRDLVLPRGTAENALWDAPLSGAREFQNPRWWAASTEWLAFVPRSPVAYNGGLFESLVTLEEKVHFASPYGYTLSGDILPSWLFIEDTLNKVVACVCNLNKLRPKLPSFPRQFGYDKVHETEEKAIAAIMESRDWFSLWIGLLHWAMHKTAGDGKLEEGDVPPRWFVELAKIYQNQVFLDNLLTEPLLQKHSTADHVGVVLHFPDGRQPQPPAAWFIYLGIPIWYRWGAREAEAAKAQPSFSLPAPPTSQLQEATMLLAPSSQLLRHKRQHPQLKQPKRESTDLSSPLNRDDSAEAVLQAFFRKRDAREKARVRQRRARLEEGEVDEDPPADSASVYVWDWDPEDPTRFARMPVPRKERQQTLANYASYQKRYDTSCREWDCCRLWDPTDENTKKGGETDSKHRSPCDQGLPDPNTHAQPDSCVLPLLTIDADVTPDGTVETRIFDLLRLHYGFVSPIPLPEITPSSNNSARNQDFLIHALGLATVPSGSSLLQKPLFQVCTQFLRKFVARMPQKPNDDEWDLSPSNRHTLISCNRLKNVRVVTAKDDPKFRMYMFDFGSEATVPWKLAVYSSATVLYICRLKEEMRDRDIAQELVRSGCPFRTFQAVDTFSDMIENNPLADSTLLPIRVRGDLFSLSDWYNYEEQQRLVLAQPRCSRAALRRGGFVWRIARDMVATNEAMAGPSGRYANSDYNFSVLDDQGIEYVDDDLTISELDVLLGYHLTSTDQLTWKRKCIWYGGRDPLAWIWWTERVERFYQRRVKLALKDEDSREPHVPKLRCPQREQDAQKCLETWSNEFLTEQLSLPNQSE